MRKSVFIIYHILMCFIQDYSDVQITINHKHSNGLLEYDNSAIIASNYNSKNVIYLQPIGKFSELQLKALELTREYLSIFYQKTTPSVINSLLR